MKRNGQYWTHDDEAALPAARSFTELAVVALRVVARMPKPIAQVCGPISTGGLGNIAKNFGVFDATIGHLIQQGITVFDQIPFEEHIFRIIENRWGTRQNNQLLEEFYLPIFSSGHVARLYFIHGWDTSTGAVWEHQQAQQRGLEIIYLEPDIVRGQLPPSL